MAGVVFVLGSSAGGVGRHVEELCAGLRGEGVDVRVVAPADTLRRFTFGVLTAPVEIGASLDPVRDLRAAAVLRSVLRAPDLRGAVVHAHGVRAGLVATAAVRTLRPRPPLVVTLHNAVLGAGSRVRLGRAVQDLVARAADEVLGVSGDLVEAARRAGARRATRALVPAPVRAAGTPAGTPAERPDGPGDVPVALVVARLAPQKGLGVLLDAVALLRRPVRVLVAGDGPLRGELADRVARERLPVELLGARADVPDLLARADLVVSASLWEGQPVFLQEALRAGVAVVATDAGGTREVTGGAADLVPAGDPAALAAAVEALLADPVRRARRGADALDRAAQLPTASEALAQVVAVHARARSRR